MVVHTHAVMLATSQSKHAKKSLYYPLSTTLYHAYSSLFHQSDSWPINRELSYEFIAKITIMNFGNDFLLPNYIIMSLEDNY